MIAVLRLSDYPEIQANLEHAATSGRGHGAWRDGDHDVVHLHSWGAYPSEMIIGHRGTVRRFPVDDRFSPKTVFRLWRATRAPIG